MIVQHEGKLASIRCFREGEFDGPPSTVGSLAPMGHRLPLLPTSKTEQAVESYEATNESAVQKNTKTTNKRVSAPGPSKSKKVDVAGVVQKTVDELLGTVVPNDAPRREPVALIDGASWVYANSGESEANAVAQADDGCDF